MQTARALENFQISGIPINHYPGLRRGLGRSSSWRRRAPTPTSARWSKAQLHAIEKACKAVLDGRYHDQFEVDWYQGGAGTSTNMNANEVLANVGLELTGHKKGEYQALDPHDDLNMSQSTNDSYPTALKVAFLLRQRQAGRRKLRKLAAAFRAKGEASLTIAQDGPHRAAGRRADDGRPGVPRLRRDAREPRSQNCSTPRRPSTPVNMGATAIGTGLNAPKGYAEKCAQRARAASPASRSSPPPT